MAELKITQDVEGEQDWEFVEQDSLDEFDKDSIRQDAVSLIEELSEGRESEILEEIAENIDGKVRSYSGRGMFGKSCLGIVCSEPYKCIEEAAKNGLTGAKMDNMGLDYIVYWPSAKVKEN